MSPDHARRLALMTGFTLSLLVVAGGALAGATSARAAEPDAPTVTFSATGAPPVACGTRPDVSSLSVPEGTAIVVANRTGVTASVVVAGGTLLSVPGGGGASIAMAPGQYQLRLVPQCAVVAGTLPLALTVSASAPTSAGPTGTIAPAPAPAGSSPTRSSTATSAAAGSGRTGGATGGSGSTGGEPVLVPAATEADPSDASTTDAAAEPSASAVVAGVISARPVTLTSEGPPKGLRLLAAVATICVLGVTVAIIRAIVRLSP